MHNGLTVYSTFWDLVANYRLQIIISLGIIFFIPISRIFVKKIIISYAEMSKKTDVRTFMIIKSVNLLISVIGVIALITIWGVNPKNLLITLSSIFAVIGVAMFAQWSILSNITAGMVLFFSVPFKIGDTIKLHDKDFEIEAEIEDITTFYVHLRHEGKLIIYPNNLFLQKGISLIKKI